MEAREKIAEIEREKNEDAIELIRGVLARLENGESVAVAVVEVRCDRGVGTVWSEGPYHSLNSGAARLASRLASDP